jgi:polyisoprenoid-binding protein YceI
VVRRRAVLSFAAGLLAIALWAPAPAGAEPVRYRILPEASKLGFYATSRLANADGRFQRFGGEVVVDPADLTTARIAVKVDAASIDTGIGKRDNHLRSEDFLHVERFPAITFESVRVEGAGRRVLLVGRLTLHGVTKEVTVPVEVSVAAGRVEARGQFDIKRTDYGIRYESFMNPIGDRVRIEFAFRAQAG